MIEELATNLSTNFGLLVVLWSFVSALSMLSRNLVVRAFGSSNYHSSSVNGR